MHVQQGDQETYQLVRRYGKWNQQLSERSAEAFYSLQGPNQEFMNSGKC